MNISTAIGQANTCEDIHRMLFDASGRCKAQAQISFWGTRYLVVLGYEGETVIDILAERVIQLAISRNFEYTSNEREIGKSIARQISQLYLDDDSVVANSNFILRLLVSFRQALESISFYCLKYPNPHFYVRRAWDDGPGVSCWTGVFEFYTPRQFREHFHRDPPGPLFESYSFPFEELGYEIPRSLILIRENERS